MRDAIVLAMVFGSIPYIMKQPWIGILMWSWISYMAPHRLTWGLAYNFPVAAVVGGTLLVSMVVSKEKLRLPKHPLLFVWILLIVWFNVTTIFALNPTGAYVEWNRSMKIQLVTFCTMMLITTRERILALVGVIAFSIGFFGVKGGIFAVLTGLQFRVGGPPDTYIAGNNEIGFALLMIVPLLRYGALQLEKKWQQLGVYAVMLLCIVSTFSTYSRGALLAMIAMGGMLVLKSRQKGVLVLLGILSLPAIIAMLPEQWFGRMSTIHTYQEDESAMGRINAWHFAWNLALDRPLTGGGFNSFTPSLFVKYAPNPTDFHASHSIYFQMIGDQGFVGLGLFLTLFVGCYVVCGRIAKRTKGYPALKWAMDLAAMLQVSLVCYAVGGAFLSLAYFDLPYHLASLSLVLAAIVDRELKTAKRTVASASGRITHGATEGMQPG